MPREYAAWESELRRTVAESVGRGRVEVLVGRQADRAPAEIVVRREVAERYVRALRELKRRFRLDGGVDLGLVASRHDVFEVRERPSDLRAERRAVELALARALAAHARERAREGAHLRRDMLARLRHLRRLWRQMRKAAAA
ncbi:MAG: hypothetical protein D6815_09235, partial [Candidatus Dadabacteria bacterium]